MSKIEHSKPEVTHHGALDMQVCVPKDWSDEQVKEFAERKYPCGTTLGWVIRKEGHPYLIGQRERVTCEGQEDFVHVMLDA